MSKSSFTDFLLKDTDQANIHYSCASYGRSMSHIKRLIEENFVLHKEFCQLENQGLNDRQPYLVRYIYLNFRTILEQIAIAIGLANKDEIFLTKNKKLFDNLSGWKWQYIFKSINQINKKFYPYPKNIKTNNYLTRSKYKKFYDFTSKYIHLKNPIDINKDHFIIKEKELVLPDSPLNLNYLQEPAQKINYWSNIIRNLLTEHYLKPSIEGCDKWFIQMNNGDGVVKIRTNFKSRPITVTEKIEQNIFNSYNKNFWRVD